MPFHSNQIIADHFLVISKTMKKTKNGDEYCQVELAHPEGVIEGKVWNDCLKLSALEKNQVSFVEGKVESYLGKLSITIKEAHIVTDKTPDELMPNEQTPTLIFDIETVGIDFETLDDVQKDYLLNNLEKNTEDKELAKGKTGLHPLFGYVSHIALMNPVTGKGKVLGLGGDGCVPENQDFTYFAAKDEKQLLTEFWGIAAKYERFVTYNGNEFDFPYLLIRSAILRVKLPFELKLSSDNFIDLCKKFKAPGGRSYKLEMIMKAVGLTNPKEQGVHGGHVSELFKEGKCQEIIDYVARDVTATGELYQLWKTYVAGKLIL